MLKKYIPISIKNLLKRILYFLKWDPWLKQSWAQEGEDMVLQRIFEHQKIGFYVDIGAHHPKRFSNTYLFYLKGWSGINVDAMPGSMDQFKKMRPRDTNIEVGVARHEGSLDYYIFNETALNGFSSQLSTERSVGENPYFIKSVVRVDVKPLHKIFESYLGGHDIDFMTIDVEGFDLEVLESNDWSKYRPKYVLAEILSCEFHGLKDNNLVEFMRRQGYEIYAKQVNTVFFKNML